MFRTQFISILIAVSIALLTSCTQEDSFAPTQQSKKVDLKLETEVSSPEFRVHFLEALGIQTAMLPEADQLKIMKQLKSSMSTEEIEAYRDAVRQIADQPTSTNTVQHMLRASNPTTMDASDGAADDFYGGAIVSRKDTVLIGAPGVGKVYVNTNVNGSLVETQILTPSNGAARFGETIVLSGRSLVVGAQGFYGGYLFVFENQNGTWVEIQTIHKEGVIDFARVLEVRANYLFTSIRDTAKNFAAEALIYKRDDSNGFWYEHQSLPISTVAWDADFFGDRLVISGIFPPFTAAVHVIERTGTTWAQTAFIPVLGTFFPRSVATHNTRIIVNGFSPFDKTYVYRNTGGGWTLEDELDINELVPFAQTRWVDIEGNRAVVSVPAYGTGDAVYEYKRVGSTWSQVAKHVPASGDDLMWYGETVKLAGPDIFIGAPGGGQQFDPTSKPAGKVYVE